MSDLSYEDVDAAMEQAQTNRPEQQNGAIVHAKPDPIEVDRAGQIQFRTTEDIKRFALLAMRSTTMQISGAKSPEDYILAITHGLEAGLSPTQCIKNVMIVNGKPAIWGDCLMAIIHASRELKEFSETIEDTEAEGLVATCRVVRRQRLIGDDFSSIETVRTFSQADADLAGLWGKRGPCSQYPNRMLQLRARAFALRDAFADKLGGLSVTEDARDYSGFDPNQMTGTKTTGSRTLAAAEEQEGNE